MGNNAGWETLELETERLRLRAWRESDAELVYRYASDRDVADNTGFLPHTSVENSKEIISRILRGPNTFAVCDKENGEPMGNVGLMIGDNSNFDLPDTEAEIGFWLGKEHWGNGYIPEAVARVIQYAFEEKEIEVLWCAADEKNHRSRRVQEKLGFQYHHTNALAFWRTTGVYRDEVVSRMTKEEWMSSVAQ